MLSRSARATLLICGRTASEVCTRTLAVDHSRHAADTPDATSQYRRWQSRPDSGQSQVAQTHGPGKCGAQPSTPVLPAHCGRTRSRASLRGAMPRTSLSAYSWSKSGVPEIGLIGLISRAISDGARSGFGVQSTLAGDASGSSDAPLVKRSLSTAPCAPMVPAGRPLACSSSWPAHMYVTSALHGGAVRDK